MDFDEGRLYYSHQALRRTNDTNETTTNFESQINNIEDTFTDIVSTNAVRRHFREFLRKYIYI